MSGLRKQNPSYLPYLREFHRPRNETDVIMLTPVYMHMCVQCGQYTRTENSSFGCEMIKNILGVTYTISYVIVHNTIKQYVVPHNDLFTTIKICKLQWYSPRMFRFCRRLLANITSVVPHPPRRIRERCVVTNVCQR